MMVRLFVAIDIPSGIRACLSALVQELRSHAPGLNWVRAENLHVTLKFIGHTADENLGAIQNALALVKAEARIAIRFRGLGFFPGEKRPRVLWAGMEAPPALAHLAAQIDAALSGLGFPPEDRVFSPHLTLSRIKDSRLPEPLRAAFRSHASDEFGETVVQNFHLIESKTRPAGAEYSTVASFAFTPGE